MGYRNLSNIVITMFGKGRYTMPKIRNQYPKNCRDRNQAFSWHNGKRIYHGVWGTPEAEREYKRFISRLLENPILSLRMDGESDVLVSELADAFLDSIESRTDKTEYLHFKYAVGYLIEVYGELAVNEFFPKKLKVARSQMVKTGKLCRSMINKYVGKIRRIFTWGVGEEVVQATVTDALKAVQDLRRGEEGTRDNPPRKGVPKDVIERTLPFLAPTVATMVQVQWLTGMRPSEAFKMRVGNIDKTRDSELWYYTPESHKTEEYIGDKDIPLGLPEQRLIEPYLAGKKPAEAVFSPRTAMKERAAEARANRKSKLTPSQRERDVRRAEKSAGRVGEFYNRDSYRRAVEYAIAKGNRHGQKIPHWTPYLLRNSAATEIELTHGFGDYRNTGNLQR
jgi:integrase